MFLRYGVPWGSNRGSQPGPPRAWWRSWGHHHLFLKEQLASAYIYPQPQPHQISHSYSQFQSIPPPHPSNIPEFPELIVPPTLKWSHHSSSCYSFFLFNEPPERPLLLIFNWFCFWPLHVLGLLVLFVVCDLMSYDLPAKFSATFDTRKNYWCQYVSAAFPTFSPTPPFPIQSGDWVWGPQKQNGQGFLTDISFLS